MLILAFESSARAASVALCRDGELIAQSLQKSGLTHSRTLLPMAEDLLKNAETELRDVDAFAVARGPGSFTGIRIGVSAVKGLSWALEKPCIGVSTLYAMALAGPTMPGTLICCAMDARREQVYNALFEADGAGECRRLCPDRAISLDELSAELKNYKKIPVLVGDGASLCYNGLRTRGVESALAPEMLRWQSAYGVALAAMRGESGTADDLLPVYLRLSQAERERQARMNK